ncbi:toxin-antitoxin system HicB family antitoxin [Nocardioides sp.]|uniref:type II toxin-antitoxin system HicB family antitoxin n=1 Tax=Nocardioides sp. TaxID=35761 RepID=UPI002614D8B3|nr:toxin-antitoxin system HicB family antitoxin [Nocardioides sp.]MDI6910481.1 toxin-antitoxin system HicB family antitoxin [Nocardioides sp.]
MSVESEQSTDPVPHYAYRVVWSPEDEEYIATALEWGPGLSWLGADPCEALRGLRALIDQAVADLREDGKPVPESLADRPYNGKVLLRMPSSLHRSLTIDAAEEGVSVNQLAIGRLSAEGRTSLRDRLISEARTERRDVLDRFADS